MTRLSPRTMQVYRHIKAHIQRHQFAPSVRQISAAACGVVTTVEA